MPTMENSSALILPLLLTKNTYQDKKTSEKIIESTDSVLIVIVFIVKDLILF